MGVGSRSAGISVVVLSRGEPDRLAASLRSLAAQTLPPDAYEIIVVVPVHAHLGGPVAAVRAAHPSVDVRVVRLGAAGTADLLESGIWAAGRECLTLVEAGDSVSPTYLAELTSGCRPRVVALADTVHVAPDGRESAGELGEALARHAGVAAPPDVIARATAHDWAKAVPTELAHDVAAEGAAAGGGSHVFWPALAARGAIFVPCGRPAKAIYYRSAPSATTDGSFDSSVRHRIEVAARLDALLDDPHLDDPHLDDPHLDDPHLDDPHLDEAPGGADWLVRDRLRHEAGDLNEYLREHPTDHGRVVELLDRHRVAGLPTEVMNRGLARGLAIAYAFPPYADASAVVAAKRIRAEAAVVDVVYNAMDKIRERDDSIRRISAPFVAREISLPSPSYFQSWTSMSAFAALGMRQIALAQAGREAYESLYSRAHFAASHLLAMTYKLANPDVGWTAEFSDPLSRDVAGRERGGEVRDDAFLTELREGVRRLGHAPPSSRNGLVWCEELTYRLADTLVFTNENQLEYMLGYCADPELAALARLKAVVRPHPTLPADFYTMVEYTYPLDPDLVHLAYFGNLYASRGLDEVLDAVAAAAPGVRGRLRLHVFTTRSDNLLRRAWELGIANELRIRPYVRYLEFLNLTTKFDCLIVNDALRPGRDVNPFLPSKWSDYRGSGTPVWGLIDDGSPLSRQALDLSSPVGDVAAAGGILEVLASRDRQQRT